MCRKSSALGLDQPGDASAGPAPKSEREFDVAALETGPGITTAIVSLETEKTPASITTEAEGCDAGATSVERDEPETAEPAPEILSGEPILPPPPASTILPKARLITAGEVTGTLQQRPSAGDAGAAGTSSCNILITSSCNLYTLSRWTSSMI